MDSDAALAAQLQNKRVLPSRARRSGLGTGITLGSSEIDGMLLNIVPPRPENEPLLHPDTSFVLRTSDDFDTLAEELNVASSSSLNLTARESYFDRPDVIRAYREQTEIETPDFEKALSIVGGSRLRVRQQQLDPQLDADEVYEKRHRKFETFEKRQRLREKEKLKHEQYKLKERIDQLRAMDQSAFYAAPSEWFSPRPRDPVLYDDDPVQGNINGNLQYAEGERRKREMIDNAVALEERYRRLLPPDRVRRSTTGNNDDGLEDIDSEFEDVAPSSRKDPQPKVMLKLPRPSTSNPTTPKPTTSGSKKRRRSPTITSAPPSPQKDSADAQPISGEMLSAPDAQRKKRSNKKRKTDDTPGPVPQLLDPAVEFVDGLLSVDESQPSPIPFPNPTETTVERPPPPLFNAPPDPDPGPEPVSAPSHVAELPLPVDVSTPPPKSPDTASYRGDSAPVRAPSVPPIATISSAVPKRKTGRQPRASSSGARRAVSAPAAKKRSQAPCGLERHAALKSHRAHRDPFGAKLQASFMKKEVDYVLPDYIFRHNIQDPLPEDHAAYAGSRTPSPVPVLTAEERQQSEAAFGTDNLSDLSEPTDSKEELDIKEDVELHQVPIATLQDDEELAGEPMAIEYGPADNMDVSELPDNDGNASRAEFPLRNNAHELKAESPLTPNEDSQPAPLNGVAPNLWEEEKDDEDHALPSYSNGHGAGSYTDGTISGQFTPEPVVEPVSNSAATEVDIPLHEADKDEADLLSDIPRKSTPHKSPSPRKATGRSKSRPVSAQITPLVTPVEEEDDFDRDPYNPSPLL